ncbi:MAG: HEPN domain-containing protein [Anaerolineae bacterium]|nr:HEPN domain-containing protein [Anaerolineae bacterium]
MDISTKRTIIRLRMDKAQEDLNAARDLLKMSHWRVAVNRAYYTNFHVVSAALLWLDIERSKHSGVQAAFSEFFIKTGLIEVEYGQIYRSARDWREEQDYNVLVQPIDEATATQIVQDAERFVARLESYLRQEGAIQ